MASKVSVVELDEAQALFASLPKTMQWSTLSPAYVAADAARDEALRPLFLVSRQGDGILMHMVHESAIAATSSVDWQSAYGYGGPLTFGLDAPALARAWQALDEVAAQRSVVAEFLRFHPMVDNYQYYCGTVRDERTVVAMDLSADDLMMSYDGRARTAIRKAERDGLVTEWDTVKEALACFPDFYRRCMREIGAADFYLFPDSYFDCLLRTPGARVLSVRQDGSRVSMGLFLFGPAQAEYHLSGTLRAARNTGATNLLLHAAARAAAEARCRTLYLGGGTSSAPDDPLLRFKKSLGYSAATFRIGYRIHDSAIYEQLRGAAPEKAASGRILFYRS